MTLPTVTGCAVATLVMFGLIEATMLGVLVTCDTAGAACGGRFLHGQQAALGNVGQKLGGLGFFLGQIFVGVVTPYAVVALVVPRPDWLAGLAVAMVSASAGFAGSAMLAAFLAGLLTTRVTVSGPQQHGPYLASEIPHRRQRYGTPQEAA